MSAPSPPPAAANLPAGAPRLVLFGMPGAGKSSLLGALAQAAAGEQESILGGRLVDAGQGLADLRRQLYEGQPQGTTAEIVPYAVTLEPAAGAPAGLPPEAILVDCDGRVANQLLAEKEHLRADRPLARAVLEADTVVLVVDASASGARLVQDFAQFKHFLGLLEQSRGRRSDLGGLPVYLVLTKCDLLAQPNDSPATWIDRIEERKRQVGQRFQEFLDRPADAAEAVPFGSIELHLWATAVKRPALVGVPARPHEPYGVAELFRQCLESAGQFHRRVVRSGRRLRWLLGGSLALLAALAGLASGFFLTPEAPEKGRFEQRVETYLARDQERTPAQRYAHVDREIEALAAFRQDPGFASLPESDRLQVNRLYAKLTEYRKFYRELLQKLTEIRQPREATSEKQLQEIETRLRDLKANLGERRVPAEFQEEWSQAPIARLPDQWLKDIAVLRREVARAVQWYDGLAYEGNGILTRFREGKLTFPQAQAEAGKLREKAHNPPFPQNDPNFKLPGAAQVTYATVYRFADVAEARQRWEQVQRDLVTRLELDKKT